MNQKQLLCLLEVYRSCNIQAAANKLYMTHQGLSRIIRTLEEELGESLFIRSNRGLLPTDFAKALVPHVQKILDGYSTIQGIHTLTGEQKSVVSVYALDHLFGFWGVNMLTRFHAQHPKITLSILDTTDEYAMDSLSAGRCDFAIVNGPIDTTRFSATQLFYSRYCLRINKNNPLSTKDSLCFEDFRGQKIIGKGRAYHCFRSNIDRHLLEAGIGVDVPIETPDEELLMQLVERNIGIAATYDFSAINHCGPNTVIRYLDDTTAGHHIYLVERFNTLPTKAGRIFKSFLLSEVASPDTQSKFLTV